MDEQKKIDRKLEKPYTNLGVKPKKYYNNRSIIGESYTIDSAQPLDYIQRIEKVSYWKFLNGTYEEKCNQHNYIFKRIKEFRLGLYLIGIDIGFKRVHWLGALGFINSKLKNSVAISHLNLAQQKYVNRFYIDSDGVMHSSTIPDKGTPDAYVYESGRADIALDDLQLAADVKKWSAKDITKDDWKIDDVSDIPDDLYEFIRNINRGWQYYQENDRFNKYRKQAYVWLERNYTLDPTWTRDRQLDFVEEERKRCLENSLYKVNKYLWYKDPDDKIKGEFKFKAWKAQEVVLFLIDLGLSLIIGKLRQIGFTTVIGGSEGLTTMLSKNAYCKMVAQKEKKSDEIFESKIKYAISKCDDYMKPTVQNWSTEKVKFGESVKKGAEMSTESIFEVVAPTEDAINAGTPSKVLLDEIGFMKLFGAIVSQGRPTMFKYKPELGKMVMTKQLIAWGTGGKTGGAGSAMQVEWQAAKEAFADKNFQHGLIPLFLNFYAKPGHDDKFYLQQKKFYYSKKKVVGEEDPKIVFHQSFPITEDDMFLESSDTVISVAAINMHIDRINKKISEEKFKSVRGWFEPIYDTSRPRGDDSYVKYDILGARFCKADQSLIDEDSEFACIEMFANPEEGWENRYWKGTDPIFTSSGHSKFASIIRDRLTKKVACRLNYKSSDYRYEYLQSLLMNLYYSKTYGGRKLGISELLEFNVGGEYYNFCRELGYGGIFTGNKMLPENLQTSTIDVGINKRGTNGALLINKLEELLMDYAQYIDDIVFWVQLKTFVRKQTATGFKYEPVNKKIHYDDDIDANLYAFINDIIHAHRPMRKVNSQEEITKQHQKKKLYFDKNFNVRCGTYAQAKRRA